MTRLKVHTQDSAPAASKPYVDKAVSNNGFLPNLIGVLANAPVALETYLTVSGINGKATLTLAEREAVQITAATIHGCEFCVSGHTAVALKKAGLDKQVVIALQNSKNTGDQRLDAVVVFTQAVIATRGNVADAQLEAFRSAGFNDEQALEVVLGVSLATLCNFANSMARSPINPQLEPYRPATFQA